MVTEYYEYNQEEEDGLFTPGAGADVLATRPDSALSEADMISMKQTDQKPAVAPRIPPLGALKKALRNPIDVQHVMDAINTPPRSRPGPGSMATPKSGLSHTPSASFTSQTVPGGADSAEVPEKPVFGSVGSIPDFESDSEDDSSGSFYSDSASDGGGDGPAMIPGNVLSPRGGSADVLTPRPVLTPVYTPRKDEGPVQPR